MSRSRERLQNVALVVASILFSLLVLEAGARVYRRVHPQPPNNEYAFRAQQPPPYRGAWYFTQAFLDEMFQAPSGWFIPPGTRLVVPGDFHGAYFHIEHGERRTTGAPASPHQRVWLLGGSAVYAGEVPDSETIPSHLQALLNDRRPGYWRVENYGSITVTAAQQVELLKTLPVAAGDLVIFFDGVNDVVQGVYNGDPHGWIAGENRKQLQGAGWLKAMLVRVHSKYLAYKLQSYSALLGTVAGNLMNGRNFYRKPHLADPAKVDSLARETADVFRENLREANGWAADRGARFLHFLQPQIYGERPTEYEQSVIGDFYINPTGLDVAFAAGYPLLRKADWAAQGVSSFDLSGVLDDRSPGEEFYLDFCHVNHIANARIASEIFTRIPQP